MRENDEKKEDQQEYRVNRVWRWFEGTGRVTWDCNESSFQKWLDYTT